MYKNKRLHLYRLTLLLVRRLPCWNKHGPKRSCWSARHVEHVVSRHDEQSGIWALLLTSYDNLHWWRVLQPSIWPLSSQDPVL